MKKILYALTLLAGFGTQASAQSIDLAAVIQSPMANQSFGPGQTLDTSKILCGVIYAGPDAIMQGEAVYVMSSFSPPGTAPGTYYISGVSFGQDITSMNPGIGTAIFVFPNSNMIGFGHTGAYKLSSDSIHVMFDWDQWSSHDSIVVVEPPFVNGKKYGFFFRAVDVRDAGGTTVGSDPLPSDNLAVTQIVWNSATGVQSLSKKENMDIAMYPNPASDKLNLSFSLNSASHCAVTIRDITGRLVMHKKYGHLQAGDQHFSLDISALGAGNYMLDLETDYSFSSNKLSVTQ